MAYANGFVIRRRDRELGPLRHPGHGKAQRRPRSMGLEGPVSVPGRRRPGGRAGRGAALPSWFLMLLPAARADCPCSLGVPDSPERRGRRGRALRRGLCPFGALSLSDATSACSARPAPSSCSTAGTAGEREPKGAMASWPCSVLVTLAGGYWPALTVDRQPSRCRPGGLLCRRWLLVIVGTHCLFGAGSRRGAQGLCAKTRALYYRPRNFIPAIRASSTA